MTRSVIAIRPQPGLATTVEIARSLDLKISAFPLSEVHPVAWEAPLASDFDALLVGSANVFRHGGQALAALRSLPVVAVGKMTADAARDAGFEVAHTGQGGLQGVLDTWPGKPTRFLRLTGDEHIALNPPAGCTIRNYVIYRLQYHDFSPELGSLLRRPALVLLHSAAAARHFASQCDRHAIARANIALAALGPRILEPVGDGWAVQRACARPDERALLAMAKDMCHEA